MDELTEGMTAYHATVVMTEAKWTDKEGSTVTFKLPMRGMEAQRNPFEKWTKRRKGHAGTRFMAAIVNIDGKAQRLTYQDEVMLAGWNDSQTNGHTVKFWLCGDVLGHPFEGFQRNTSKFFISLVELDDDNEPIDQKMRARVENPPKRPSERLSYVAAMLCKNEGFHTYIAEVADEEWHNAHENEDPEEYARQYILDRLEIKSRSELDKSDALARAFHEDIRRPFLEWQGEPQVDVQSVLG